MKNWITTSDTNVIVMASSWPRPDWSAQVKRPRFAIADHSPPAAISETTGRVKMPTRGLRGFQLMMSGSGGSTASARAGRPSVARFT